MKVGTEEGHLRHWLWVTHPEYYLDENGAPREDLEPGHGNDGWWTCHKDTKAGDLVLLYRTSPKRDIAYLMQAEGNAFPLEHDAYAREHGWAYGCEFRSLFRFHVPLGLAELRNDASLENWPALRDCFQRKAFAIAPDVWLRLTQLLEDDNPGYASVLAASGTLPRDVTNEKDMEDRLSVGLHLLKPFGYDLELYRDELGRTGRQFVCASIQGRMDLLCRARANGEYIVIELKAVRAEGHTYAQVQAYMGWVMDNLPHGSHVRGLVVSEGTDAWFDSAARASRGTVRQLDRKDVGL